MHFFGKPKYLRVPAQENDWDEESMKTPTGTTVQNLRITQIWRMSLFNITTLRLNSLISTTSLCIVLSLCLFGASLEIAKLRSLQHNLQKTSIQSPAFEAVELVNMDLPNQFDSKNEYRGPPTPAREAAWHKLWNQKEIFIEEGAMAGLNRSGDVLNDYVRSSVGNQQGFIGGLEVFHQLHCLNFVRQFTWYLMDKYDDETMPDEYRSAPLKNLRMHTDHCIETLRLTLMCHSDVTPIMLTVDRHYDPPRHAPDFRSHHRCRNFDKILQWNEKHGLDNF